MIELKSVEKINSLKRGIEDVTGETYADLTEAVQCLKDGYGNGDITNDKKWIEGIITEVDNDMVTHMRHYAFFGCSKLQAVNLPTVTEISQGAFWNCESLQTANFPLVESIGMYAFDFCESLQTANFPLVTNIQS